MTELTVSGPQEAVMLSTSDRTLFLAGVGSGKSHGIALESAEYIVNFPEVSGFIGANTYRQLSQSTLKRVFDTWLKEFNWVKGIDYVVDNIPPEHFRRFGAPLKSYESTICFATGCMILTASLENYKVLDGTEFGWAMLDETKDTKEEAVKEVIVARLRQQGMWIDEAGVLYNRANFNARLVDGRWRLDASSGSLQLLDMETGGQIRAYTPLKIYTSPAKVDWLNLWFGLTKYYEQIQKRIFSKTDFFYLADQNKCVVIGSTYHNQYNLPIGYIDKLLEAYAGNENLIEMLIYGSPIAKAGGEFVPSFNRLQHVKAVTHDPNEPVHVTYDFNVVPHMTELCAQLVQGDDGRLKLRVFREYCLAAPLNNTAAVCNALLNEYGQELYQGLFFYGDPAGRARQTVTTEYTDNYDVIAKLLAGYAGSNSDRVAHAAPSVVKSRDFLTALFNGNYGIDIEIDESCEHFIHDLEYCKEGPDGKMLKPKYKDPQTKQTYERYGHCLDAFRYLVCQMLYEYYQQFISSQLQPYDQDQQV
jgi:hypothetical protein